MRVFDAEATARRLPLDQLVPALRAQFAAGAEVPPRHVHALAGPDGATAVTSLLMPAWGAGRQGRYYAVKVINVAPGNAVRGLPGLHGSVLLHDADTGVPLALLDGNELTARRTAAASALAASFLALEAPLNLLVVGAGRVAALLPAAYRCVRPLARVQVWARDPSQAARLAARWCGEGHPAAAVDDLARAAAEADVVSCATLATAPLVQGAWLRPGSHLDLIGGFTPAMREADDACFVGARLFVDTDEALRKSGDLLGPMSRGVFTAADVQGTLAALARGEATGCRAAEARTVFKSVGTALEDLAAAVLAWEGAPT